MTTRATRLIRADDMLTTTRRRGRWQTLATPLTRRQSLRHLQAALSRAAAAREDTDPLTELVLMRELKPSVAFSRIVEVAATQWIPGAEDRRTRRATGSVETRQHRRITPELTYNPETEQVQLQAVYAQRIKQYSRRFLDLLNRATAGQPNALASPDNESQHVKLYAVADCVPFDELIPSAVMHLFERFFALLSHELLFTAVQVGDGELCGVLLLDRQTL